MQGKTIQEFLHSDAIEWKQLWEYIDTFDDYLKRHRLPRRHRCRFSRDQYNCPQIFRSRFNQDGTVRHSYREIAKQFRLLPEDKGSTFVARIIERMLQMLNHPHRRPHWDRSPRRFL